MFPLFSCRIGPEPTTDAFTAVMYGENEQASSDPLKISTFPFLSFFLRMDGTNVGIAGDSRERLGCRQVTPIQTSHQIRRSIPQQVLCHLKLDSIIYNNNILLIFLLVCSGSSAPS